MVASRVVMGITANIADNVAPSRFLTGAFRNLCVGSA